mmetsp:Transcript_69412/g.123671  ORF Transcript_69412/g.123671 Transcript_69412/m.123671 type:complete len:630 (-) Transcript_69412:23-1912(-)
MLRRSIRQPVRASYMQIRMIFDGNEKPHWSQRYGGHSRRELPDFVEKWGRKPFYTVGAAGTIGSLAAGLALSGNWWATVPVMGAYWYVGLRDIRSSQPIRRNFPVLGHVRYMLESVRPEIRQYFIESDKEQVPFSREQRSRVYQRARGMDAVQSFGSRSNFYDEGYEWLAHSNLATREAKTSADMKVFVGARCREPYHASILNISAMSYGALSRNAVLALNEGAKIGGFYHNTGEGGVSPHHLKPGGDIVWNIGTGYFGCRTPDGEFSEKAFAKVAALPSVKMIEVKLSQGAKPGHGGLLPASKLTAELAEIRGVPLGKDVHSPAMHSAFSGSRGLIEFLARLRRISGKPVGFKMSVGNMQEVAEMVRAMHEMQDWPDFITVDGGEGGTGAAPHEFSNRVGMPLVDALVLVVDMLQGAGLRDKVRVICSGKVTSPYDVARNAALGADICNSARAMMFALGCIQALKCNTNKCPTGITTQDPELMAGLHIASKSQRVASYQKKVVNTVGELVAAAGVESLHELRRHHIFRRHNHAVCSLADVYPEVQPGSFLRGAGPAHLQALWDKANPSRFLSAKRKGQAEALFLSPAPTGGLESHSEAWGGPPSQQPVDNCSSVHVHVRQGSQGLPGI